MRDCGITIGTWLDGHWDGGGNFVPVRRVFAMVIYKKRRPSGGKKKVFDDAHGNAGVESSMNLQHSELG